ncbi:CAP domain-containing protein [Patescibacteria group bacterium]
MIKTLASLFIPNQTNNHKAKTLHLSSLSIFMIIIMFSQILLSFIGNNISSVLGVSSSITAQEIVNLTNIKRQENGLSDLEISPRLVDAAALKGADMVVKNYWAHTSPDGTNPWTFFKTADYQYLYAGENLARDFLDSASVIDAWMDSPTHRENLLSSRYQDIGIAVIHDNFQGQPTTLVVQLFGTQVGDVLPLPEGTVGENAEALISEIATTQQVAGFKDKLPLLNSFTLTKAMSISLTIILLAAIVIDTIVITKKKIIRLSGKGMAHLVFLSLLLLILLGIQPGLIL